MATSLLLLLDDIASVLDDVATMTKVAAKKTAAVLGDDLALNAKQVTGTHPARELAVVWAVAKGSIVNKAILVPAALLISWLVPWLIPPLLVAGGAFLCYEGAEKILHAVLHRGRHHSPAAVDHSPAAERRKIRGAIRTDFILSAEIIVITLNIVAGQPLTTQVGTLVAIAGLMTVGVYGLVAAIVKLDDLGAALALSPSAALAALGRGIVTAAPWLMRILSVAGTLAMFFVGGGIIVHQLHEHVPAVHRLLEEGLAGLGIGGSAGHAGWGGPLEKLLEAVAGLVLGLLIVGGVSLGRLGGRAFQKAA